MNPLKLLDYGNPNPFGETIGKPRHLGWPVNVYRVTLPSESDDGEGVNAFERVIMKLIDAGGYRETKMLAEETCMPESLVQCVLLRLQDRGYLDRYNQIVKQQRNKWAHDEDRQRVYVTALMFRELATGRILPFLHILSQDTPLKKKDQEEELINNRKRYHGIYDDRALAAELPIPSDVIFALRAMKKRSRAAFGDDLRLPPVRQITIGPDPEPYHLDCLIAIQKSDSEYRIADPFGSGFSLVLENAFRQLLEQDSWWSNWLDDWKKGLTQRQMPSQNKKSKEPYDNESNWGNYRNLISNLSSHIKHDRQYRSIEEIHFSLEWALFYSCYQYPYDHAVNMLKLRNQSEHTALLQAAAEELSLELPKGGLYPVKEGKLNDFLNGKAEFGTVLSLALLIAESDTSHPLRRIAQKHPDFIVRLLKIKKERDAPGHGRGKVRRNSSELEQEPFMYEVISALLPAIRFSDTPVAEVDRDAIADAWMEARRSIQNEFTHALFNRLGTNLQDRLIMAEKFWLLCNGKNVTESSKCVTASEATDSHRYDAQMFAWNLYGALQGTFRMTLSGVLPPDIKTTEYIASAREKADRCGLGELPKGLTTGSILPIFETLLGNDQTLRACAVAFLLVSDDESLCAIAQKSTRFLADIALVHERRRHGNEPLPLSKDEILDLRKAAYTTIKTLLEA